MAKKSRAFAVLLPLAVAALTLGLAEAALRAFAPLHMVGIQRAYQYDEELGYRLAAGSHQYQLTDHLEEIRTNGLGTVNYQESFAAYPVLVFAAGDSFTQGTGNPPDASYPLQLDLLLNRDASGAYVPRWGVVNLGLAAFGTEQSLLAIRRYSETLGKPAFVLYMGSDNDAEDDVLFRAGYRHRHVVAGSPRWGGLVGPLLWLSDFEIVKRTKFALGQMQRASHAGVATDAAAATSVAETVWPVLAQVIAQARAWGAIPIISWANPDSASYEWLRARAAAEGVTFADWRPAVRSVQEHLPGLPLENPHSGGHWRAWANGVIAGAFAKEIRAAPVPAGTQFSVPSP